MPWQMSTDFSSVAAMRQEFVALEAALNCLPGYLLLTTNATNTLTLIECFLSLPDEVFLRYAKLPYSDDDARASYAVVLDRAQRLLSEPEWQEFLARNGLA